MNHILQLNTFLLLSLLLLARVGAIFYFKDFNQTLGLVFNGNAITTTCLNDTYVNNTAIQSGETRGIHVTQVTETNDIESNLLNVSRNHDQQGMAYIEGNDNAYDEELSDPIYAANHNISESVARFGHRIYYTSNRTNSINNSCATRLRLTPAKKNQTGSVFYEKRMPVLSEFDTTFTFQITGQSQTCSYHRDPAFSLKLYQSCAVHGGDGFAFVLHSDEGDAFAIGQGANQMGYGGLRNSLAIEFDMWTNTGENEDDLFYDHVSIHSAGTKLNRSDKSTSLGYSRPVDMADGEIHKVRIKYFPSLQMKYLTGMSASPTLVPYLKDNGEGRRLGTLAIYIDERIDRDQPNLSIPLNLSVLLDLPDSLAYVGFTAGTGAQWENHDILSWEWCTSSGCKSLERNEGQNST